MLPDIAMMINLEARRSSADLIKILHRLSARIACDLLFDSKVLPHNPQFHGPTFSKKCAELLFYILFQWIS